MWNISVEPMPSMMSIPVAFFHSVRVPGGSASPADTHLRSDERSCCRALGAIARYDVGAVNSTVARCSAIAGRSASGAGRSSKSVEAPIRSGKNRSPPRPNVNARGGLPVNTSSAVARSIEGGQHSHAAIRSRWKCIVPLGLPVVPEVNAISAVSSAMVSTAAKRAGLETIRASSPSPAGPLKRATCASVRHCARARSSSVASRASHSACEISPLMMISVSSFARRSGIVPTAMPPALSTARKHAAYIGLFGARNSTRFPGTTPRSSTSTRAIRLAAASSSRYVQRKPPGARIAMRSPCPRSMTPPSSTLAAFIRSGSWSAGSSKMNSGHASRGGS